MTTSATPESYPRVQEALSKIYRKRYETVPHWDIESHNVLWKDGCILVVGWETSGWFTDYNKLHAASDDVDGWWTMLKEIVDHHYDDGVELAARISEW